VRGKIVDNRSAGILVGKTPSGMVALRQQNFRAPLSRELLDSKNAYDYTGLYILIGKSK